MSDQNATTELAQLPDLPLGLTSFGATFCKHSIFIWGGHSGAAHEYYAEGQNRWLWQLDLDGSNAWQRVHESTIGRQGLALVSFQDSLYRVGGFEARNAQQEDQNLHSVANFERFDEDRQSWLSLPDMPEPRSSFDAVIIGHHLFVVGGWALAGQSDTKWLSNAVCIDLSNSDAQWQTLPQPSFQRRAISIASQDGKLYVIGGMQMNGGPTKQVSVFDPKAQRWSTGPPIPGDDEMEGFGTSSFNIAVRKVNANGVGKPFGV